MDIGSVRDALFELVEKFYPKATVIWTEQIATRPKLPYVTLKMRDMKRDTFASEDAEGHRYYNASVKLEINLYTKGRPVGSKNSQIQNYENTATSDLSDFFKYLDSDDGLNELENKGLSLMLTPPVRDLTELMNDSNYRYRAMAEAEVGYIEEADGMYGVYGRELPNPSGGGSEKMAVTQIEEINKVEIEEVNE